MQLPRDLIDADAQKVVERLLRHGHQAYLVGGCVRDLLLGRRPKDFDVATSATPSEIRGVFRNCRIIGRRFRLAHVFFGAKIIETATFRSNPRDVEPLGDEEIEGEEGAEAPDEDEDLLIRQDNVFGTAEEDARRRDFTINGLFYDLEAGRVIDHVGGIEDLERRLIRTIGDPDVRFREDPVRILRAIKFSSRLSFRIEDATWAAMLAHREEIPRCPMARVLEDTLRLLRQGAAGRAVELLRLTGILGLLLPEIDALLADPAEGARVRRALARVAATPDDALTNTVLLSVLGGLLCGPLLVEEERLALRDAAVAERARPPLDRLRVSRRERERMRQVLLMLRDLLPSRRKRRPGALLRRDVFGEALLVLELLGPDLVDVTVLETEVGRWKARLRGEEPPADATPPPSPAAPGKRRRRRGGRRRRTGEPGTGGAPA